MKQKSNRKKLKSFLESYIHKHYDGLLSFLSKSGDRKKEVTLEVQEVINEGQQYNVQFSCEELEGDNYAAHTSIGNESVTIEGTIHGTESIEATKYKIELKLIIRS